MKMILHKLALMDEIYSVYFSFDKAEVHVQSVIASHAFCVYYGVIIFLCYIHSALVVDKGYCAAPRADDNDINNTRTMFMCCRHDLSHYECSPIQP